MDGCRRERWIDSWKGFLIFLVVLGHVAGVMYHLTRGEGQSVAAFIYRWIYLFHMPAFFFVVGYVRGLRMQNYMPDWGGIIKKRAVRLLVPYAFWGIVSVLIFLTMTALVGRMQGYGANDYYRYAMDGIPWWRPFLSLLHAGGWPNNEGFRCNSVLWFLPCMFVTQVLFEGVMRFRHFLSRFQAFRGILVDCVLMLGCFILGGAVRLYVGGLPWCLDRAIRYLGFVVLGMMVGRFLRDSNHWSCHKVVEKYLIVFGGWSAFSCFVLIFPDLSWAYTCWSGYWAATSMAIAGCCLSLGCAWLLDCDWVAKLGIASLGIMVTHKFAILFLQSIYPGEKVLARLEGGCVVTCASLLIAVAVTGVTCAMTWIVRRKYPILLGEGK